MSFINPPNSLITIIPPPPTVPPPPPPPPAPAPAPVAPPPPPPLPPAPSTRLLWNKPPENGWTPQPGDMWWLPPAQWFRPWYLPLGADVLRWAGHPVVVMSVDRARKEATICVKRSFGESSLYDVRPALNREERKDHIPVFPNPPHPDNGSLVYVAREPPKDVDYKPGYIWIGRDVVIPWGLLSGRRQTVLDRDSFEWLKEQRARAKLFHNQ
ncbi:hypothetical protein EJ08DRAFT_721205 [Tothia fuscella]|uniref:Uncharacterized protein n=1 Tax=Tothia fuscella TaxID=1048955 RepID=A0A9P4TWQ9_9PEZI|nr:hypothetical protein EJ08DRAFT_721205 [Tothia fuscella]